LVDTLGLVLEVRVHAASVQDRDGAKLVLQPLVTKHWRLKKIWADQNYRGELIEWVKALRAGRGRRRIESLRVHSPQLAALNCVDEPLHPQKP
jgi:DDE family transposase